MLTSLPTLTLPLSISPPPPSPVWIAWCFWTALPHVPYGDQVLFWKKMENCIQSDNTSVFCFVFLWVLILKVLKLILSSGTFLCLTHSVSSLTQSFLGKLRWNLSECYFLLQAVGFLFLTKNNMNIMCLRGYYRVYWFCFWHFEWP